MREKVGVDVQEKDGLLDKVKAGRIRKYERLVWSLEEASRQLGVNDDRRRKTRKRKTRTETNGMDRQHRDMDDQRNARSTQRTWRGERKCRSTGDGL